MRASQSLVLPLLAAQASAHGVVTMIRGANGVNMPGLTVTDGTPRDCSTNRCGSQADTAIIRDREIRSGQVGPLGRTQGNGPVDAAVMVATFMGGRNGFTATNNGSASSVGEEDDLSAFGLGGGNNNNNNRRDTTAQSGGVIKYPRQFLQRLFGGGGRGGSGSSPAAATETNVAALAGQGASRGLPTCADDGSIEMVFHQINQDGAGPLTASIDATSGGTDPAAFQTAEVTRDVPGFGVQGISLATSTDFPLTVRMPAGMTCEGTVAGVSNVCIVRVRNGAAAGPFGGSAAFTQSPAARKRAIAYRMKKRAAAFQA